MSIKYMKLISSEEIVAEVREESADTYTLANPVSVMFSNDQLAFARWAPLQDQDCQELTYILGFLPHLSQMWKGICRGEQNEKSHEAATYC